MSDRHDHDDDRNASVILSRVIANVALAFAAGWIVSRLLGMVGAELPLASRANMITFFAVLYAAPIGSPRRRRTMAVILTKLGVGALLGLVASVLVGVSLSGMEAPADTAEAVVAATQARGGLPRSFVLLALIVPLMAVAPLLERAVGAVLGRLRAQLHG